VLPLLEALSKHDLRVPAGEEAGEDPLALELASQALVVEAAEEEPAPPQIEAAEDRPARSALRLRGPAGLHARTVPPREA
jgi:hypothetical protein